MKKLVVLTGAGISAESGIATFRDSGGLWEGHRMEDVATSEGWMRNPKLVLDFYNERRKKALHVKPNLAHHILADLQEKMDVTIITQNVDDLHEKAGSKNVLHLHGKLFEVRSTKNPKLIYPINGWELKLGDVCELGSQLRPNIVWFGEAVPAIEVATEWAASADIFVVIGTSLLVYPAAGLIDYVKDEVPKFIIDPKKPAIMHVPNLYFITEIASVGIAQLKAKLVTEFTLPDQVKSS